MKNVKKSVQNAPRSFKRMLPLHLTIRELALKVDRVLLKLEDETHLRLDLAAHESIRLPWNRISKRLQAWLQTKAWLKTSAVFFVGLFLITNAPAYTKILKASVLDFTQELATEELLALGEQKELEASREAAHLPLLSEDALTASPRAETVLVPLDVAGTSTEKAASTKKQAASSKKTKDDLPAALAAWLWAPSSFENRIDIPSLKISAPIVEPHLGLDALESEDWEALEEQIHDSLKLGVVHYPGTAEPGQKGNTVLTGHSSNVLWEKSDYNTVFALLPKMKVGDTFTITYHQNKYHYAVTDRKEVSPKEVEVLSQEGEHRLTLITCTPVGTTLRRLVLTAELIEKDL